ncbi:hypothetical protein L2D08_15320 [Domibacillus sp. PGB-M46]|uniref:hypothetical protein n=1 Tax=Domibacillus sp. PGB-M46 TaxID=2910255 RepID=UPI001F5AC599|nr:hypothetical protein [Domibacillus sp. PGB-M46]MCI2255741.1 hypothetical protein [Domibacillus sp. PGB-M46]
MAQDLKTLQQPSVLDQKKARVCLIECLKNRLKREVLSLAVLGLRCDSTIMTRHTKFKAKKEEKPLNILTAQFLESLYDVFKEHCDELELFFSGVIYLLIQRE